MSSSLADEVVVDMRAGVSRTGGPTTVLISDRVINPFCNGRIINPSYIGRIDNPTYRFTYVHVGRDASPVQSALESQPPVLRSGNIFIKNLFTLPTDLYLTSELKETHAAHSHHDSVKPAGL